MMPPHVSICFADAPIAALFTELFEAHGACASVIEHPAQASMEGLLVTEPQYFSDVPEELLTRTLVIGNNDTVHQFASYSVARPLTIEKVEQAIVRLLQLFEDSKDDEVSITA